MIEERKFSFIGTIKGKRKDLSVSVPVENQYVHTNRFCPQILLTGERDFLSVIHGESIEEFLTDCRNQIKAMEIIGKQRNLLEIHIGGLIAVVMDHLANYGRLIFGDLLLYMDCFSLLLEANRFPVEEIREMYPIITRTIVNLYPDCIFNTFEPLPFKDCTFDRILTNLTRKRKNIIGH